MLLDWMSQAYWSLIENLPDKVLFQAVPTAPEIEWFAMDADVFHQACNGGDFAGCRKRNAGLEQKHNLPGSHSVAENELKWNHYSWERGENEWTQSEEWKSSLIEHVMLKNIAPGHVVVEIGPGFGRWTRKLIELSKRLIVVDVTEKCIAHCKRLFADKDNVEFHINDGRSLDVVADDSVDYVWSFDVFVHIEPPDIEHYLREFRRILKNDGITIIHHGIAGKTDLSWRSSLTLEVFTALLEKHDFALLQQFDSWGEDDEYRVISSDVISIFKKA